jgi:hypothetical protein
MFVPVPGWNVDSDGNKLEEISLENQDLSLATFFTDKWVLSCSDGLRLAQGCLLSAARSSVGTRLRGCGLCSCRPWPPHLWCSPRPADHSGALLLQVVIWQGQHRRHHEGLEPS